MVTVHLHKVILYGFHGLYEEERKLANTFELNIDVSYNDTSSSFEKISDTVDYETIFKLAKQEIDQPTLLLEKICQNLIHAIKDRYSFVKKIAITIEKVHAPIENFQGRPGVTITQTF